MSGNFIDPSRRVLTARGFTLPELVIVMLLASIMAAFALPRFDAVLSFRNDGWRDQVLSALRYAQKSAVSHRRMVCVNVNADKVLLTIATVRGSASCDQPLKGGDGSTTFSNSGSSTITAVVSPAGAIYFQPDGRATSDGGGSVTAGRTITVSGADTIQLFGETGYAQ